MKKNCKHLLNKSQEAFILALEIYNKPTIKYRIEGFCFFFINAWELLLKAKIIQDTGKESSIYYKKIRKGRSETISLQDALNKIFNNPRNPVRKNIEDIAEIRHSATHFIIEELDSIYSGLFQAGVFNFISKLNEWFNISISEKITPAMMALVTEPKQIEPVLIKKKYGGKILEFFLNEKERISNSESEIKSKEYKIPIEYKVALVKSPKNADIVFTTGENGKTQAIPIFVPKDVSKTHPYLQNEAILKVKEAFEEDFRFTQYDFQSIIYKEKIKGNNKFHYCLQKINTHLYSNELIEFIVEKIRKNSNYLNECRNEYKAYLRKRRKK